MTSPNWTPLPGAHPHGRTVQLPQLPPSCPPAAPAPSTCRSKVMRTVFNCAESEMFERGFSVPFS